MFDIRRGDNGMIEVQGRFDASQVTKAREGLDKLNDSAKLDFSELDYISSAGIGAIVVTYRRLSEIGKTLSLANLSPRIRNVFHYAGLDRIITIE